MPTKSSTILICSVGGSHQPIITAIRELRPDFVCFICSGKDPGTGRSGSDIQIIGKGKVIRNNPAAPAPNLPNIPIQAGLAEDQFKVVIVPSDDLDDATQKVMAAIDVLRDDFPDARLIADYTGGTKSMTAALIFAAVEKDIELQLVTGNRADLVKVRDGTQCVTDANIAGMQLRWRMAPYLSAWARFAYDEAAIGLKEAIKTPCDNQLRQNLFRARDLSAAFAAWDRFDHAGAMHLLEPYAPLIGDKLGAHLSTLHYLAESALQTEPMQILDLWRNAERRAVQGRYDDAVARIYRLLEWSAQWLLRHHCEIDTSDIEAEYLPAGFEITPGRNGKIQTGLLASWELAAKKIGGRVAGFFNNQSNSMLNNISIRNRSILAHGFTPVSKEAWENFSQWVQEQLLPLLMAEFTAMHVKRLPPQLPNSYLWSQGII